MQNILPRFESKFKKTNGCWEWQANISIYGYGYFWMDRKNQRAHRVAYKLYKGDIPSGMIVCHSCDNRKCVNPDHLWIGSNADNQIDCVVKGRNYEQNKTHCPAGHEYTPENTKVNKKTHHRKCRKCCRQLQRIYTKKKLGVVLPPFPSIYTQGEQNA